MSLAALDKKSKMLGMPYATAFNRLRKQVMFELLTGRQFSSLCFKCGQPITSAEELSIEHKIPWEGNAVSLFWDIGNIAFSHRRCNRPHRPSHGLRKIGPPGTAWCWKHQLFLPVDRFYPNARHWNGLSDRCIDCTAANNRRRVRGRGPGIDEGPGSNPGAGKTVAGAIPVSSAIVT